VSEISEGSLRSLRRASTGWAQCCKESNEEGVSWAGNDPKTLVPGQTDCNRCLSAQGGMVAADHMRN